MEPLTAGEIALDDELSKQTFSSLITRISPFMQWVNFTKAVKLIA
jgi:hypothetical protein